jgi:hypothetical protein
MMKSADGLYINMTNAFFMHLNLDDKKYDFRILVNSDAIGDKDTCKLKHLLMAYIR